MDIILTKDLDCCCCTVDTGTGTKFKNLWVFADIYNEDKETLQREAGKRACYLMKLVRTIVFVEHLI